MLLMAFFSWWYGSGWLNNIHQTRHRLLRFANNFSVGILLRTLFAPWKQIDGAIPTQVGQDKIHQAMDSLISRLVGFVVRSLTLIAAFFGLILMMIFQLILIIIWPLLPLSVIAALLWAAGVI